MCNGFILPQLPPPRPSQSAPSASTLFGFRSRWMPFFVYFMFANTLSSLSSDSMYVASRVFSTHTLKKSRFQNLGTLPGFRVLLRISFIVRFSACRFLSEVCLLTLSHSPLFGIEKIVTSCRGLNTQTLPTEKLVSPV